MRTRPLLVLSVVSLVALSGCTGGGDDAESPAPVTSASAGPGDDSAGSAPGSTDAVLAEQTFDASVNATADTNVGGTITATVRSLEVAGDTMVLRWAMRWDDDASEDDAVASMYDLGIGRTPRMTDTANLKQYLPLCRSGSWQESALDQQRCSLSALSEPHDVLTTGLGNHLTVEGWTAFAAPQDDDAVLDVQLSDQWPAFTGVTPVER